MIAFSKANYEVSFFISRICTDKMDLKKPDAKKRNGKRRDLIKVF
jgi:hypothetical protein